MLEPDGGWRLVVTSCYALNTYDQRALIEIGCDKGLDNILVVTSLYLIVVRGRWRLVVTSCYALNTFDKRGLTITGCDIPVPDAVMVE